MKKAFVTILAVLMLIAFVACSPDANAGGNSESLLPGEVTPPAESSKVSATDDEINKAFKLLMDHVDGDDGYRKKELIEKAVLECNDYNNGTLSLKAESNHMTDEAEYSANGQITLDGRPYKFDNYVLKVSKSGEYSHEGSCFDKEEEMTEESALKLLEKFAWNFSYYCKNDCSTYTLKNTRIVKVDFLDEKGHTVGSSTTSMVTEETEKKTTYTEIFDLTYGKDRVQCKVSKDSNSKDYTCEYVALNGKFFDKESVSKFMKNFG